ncbi:hypothetical protein ScPMuIL_015332 [Solemya velum]
MSSALEGESEPSTEEMERMMIQKAHELFELCDKEEKGFITKRDMQRLQTELPLSPDQLEAVFDSLDDDGNGFLTLQEFTDGFGGFLGLKNTPDMNETAESNEVFEAEDGDNLEEELMFNEVMSNIGYQFAGSDGVTIKALWSRLRKEDPDMLSHFEEFVTKVSTDIRKSQMDCDQLESVLKSKSTAHDEEVRKLYEEMEYQIKTEKEQILLEEKAKERQLRETMEKELSEKDRILQDLLQKHQEMENKLKKINMIEAETKQENEKLMKERNELEEMLMHSQINLDESKSYISQLSDQQKNEKRDRARAALQLSEGIALERECLVKQLDMLRDINKRLRDDKDEAEIRRMEKSKPRPENRWPKKKELAKQGSVLSDYFPPSLSAGQSTRGSYSESVNENSVDIEDDGIEYDDDSILSDSSSNYNVAPMIIHQTHHMNGDINSYKKNANEYPLELNGSVHNKMTRKHNILSRDMDMTSSESEAVGHERRVKRHRRYSKRLSRSNESLPEGMERSIGPYKSNELRYHAKDPRYPSTGPSTFGSVAMTSSAITAFATPKLPSSSRLELGQPCTRSVSHTDISAGTVHDSETESRLFGEPSAPTRVFKVVFVGDSGVGKSSFIHRFCSNTFKSNFSATIGVDFQVKAVNVDGNLVALQLWDTAGQERFRSITKQYFRKADGVLVMYDVTSESTYTNVRNWMNSVQQGVDEGTVLVLIGNKTDLSEEDNHRAVKLRDGAHLADEYGALFFETSAKSGVNVPETIHALARLLKDKEDKEMEDALHLEDEPVKKKGCCG